MLHDPDPKYDTSNKRLLTVCTLAVSDTPSAIAELVHTVVEYEWYVIPLTVLSWGTVSIILTLYTSCSVTLTGLTNLQHNKLSDRTGFEAYFQVRIWKITIVKPIILKKSWIWYFDIMLCGIVCVYNSNRILLSFDLGWMMSSYNSKAVMIKK